MAGEPINLNRARKARVKSAQTAQAAQNRAKFGQTKACKAAAKTEAAKLLHAVDDHRRET